MQSNASVDGNLFNRRNGPEIKSAQHYTTIASASFSVPGYARKRERQIGRTACFALGYCQQTEHISDFALSKTIHRGQISDDRLVQ